MKIRVLFIFLCISIELKAQVPKLLHLDTLALEIQSDESIQLSNNQIDVLNVFQKESPIFIKNYGPNNLATISLQGTSSSQSNLIWNGVNLNPLNVGGVDFSLIDAFHFNNLQLQIGNNQQQNSGIGGDLILRNSDSYDSLWHTKCSYQLGSFGNNQLGLKVLKSGKNGQLNVSILGQRNKNDFPYYHFTERNWQKRINNEANTLSGLVAWNKTWRKNNISIQSWNKWADRNIPSSILTVEQFENQKDIFSRNFIGWERCSKKVEWKAQFMHLYDDYKYENPTSNILGLGIVHRFNQQISMETNLIKLLKISVLQYNDLAWAEVGGESKRRNLSGLSSQLTWRKKQIEIKGLAQSEVIWQTSKSIFNYGLDLNYFASNKMSFYLKYAQKGRFPGLNDLYWPQGGNPNLNSELGKTSYLGFKLNKKVNLTTEVFYGTINNQIVWYPDAQLGFWQPENIFFSTRYGINNRIAYPITVKKVKSKIQLIYSFVSIENESQIQAIYVPRNEFKGSVKVEWKSFETEFFTYWVSKRFTTRDASEFLPQYSVSDFFIRKKINFKKVYLVSELAVQNLMNYTYYTIPFRPMLGRNFSLKLSLAL